MTDTESAQEYAEEYQIKKHHKRLFGHKPVVMKELNMTFKDGFLAGFEAARQEKWHDLRKDPNDLPEAYMSVVNQNGVDVIYDDTKKVWRYNDADECICDTPIAWCEIPTFEV